jgi:hypothetical protein
MPNVVDNLFGPLSKDYCIYFYILSIVGFVLLALFLIPAIFMGIAKRKGIDYYFTILGVSFGYAIFYFQNRLLHSMCMGTMN